MKEILKQHLSSLITGFISLVAITFTFIQTNRTLEASERTTKRQLRIQLATTTEKDWINEVRTLSTSMMSQSAHISIALEATGKAPTDRVESCMLSMVSLKILLNPDNPLEKDLLNDIDELGEQFAKAEEGKGFQLGKLNGKITQDVRKIIQGRETKFEKILQ
jgi:hypothetical protein